MTYFGAIAAIEETDSFMPTFKVEGQMYHKFGSLLPVPNENPTFYKFILRDIIKLRSIDAVKPSPI